MWPEHTRVGETMNLLAQTRTLFTTVTKTQAQKNRLVKHFTIIMHAQFCQQATCEQGLTHICNDELAIAILQQGCVLHDVN